MRKTKKTIAALLSLSMVAMSASAAFAEEATSTPAENDAAVAAEDAAPAGDGSTPLVVAYGTFSQKFNPYFCDTQYDRDAVDLTQATILTTDRMGGIVYNAIEGETISYNGTDYTYTGIADVSVERDEDADTTTYTAKLRDDLKFSDGEPVTADDVIFNYYVYLDNSYVGSSTLNSYDIVGLPEYRLNSTKAADVEITQDDVLAYYKDADDEFSEDLKAAVNELLTSEYSWCEDVYADNGAASAGEFFVQCYSTDDTYEAGDKDADTLISDVAAMYGTDYYTLCADYYGDADLAATFTSQIETYLGEKAVADLGGEEVPNIAGIQKIDDYTVSVTTNGYAAPAIYQIFGFEVAPMHYYGDVAKYDYENNQFGFDRGAYTLDAEKATHPVGMGPYKFIEYSNKVVYYEANENYYKGEPKTKNLQLKEVKPDEVAASVQTGTTDCGEMTGSKIRFQEVQSYNSNGDIDGDVIETSKVDNLGYGYIGMNADTINVAGDPSSEQSKDLRKALATILSVYRDSAVDSYYGEAASVINYPISNTSWAAPQVTDSDYKVAFSVDVDGNDIYTSDMTADEKYAAAKTAALGYLEAAGYTVADGKVTAAPEGAKLSYEVIIPAGGSGDHPSFAILTDAQNAFAEIGMELKINDPSDSNILWNSLDAGTQELWCAAWSSTIDPDMYQVYHSSGIIGRGGSDSNHYHIDDANLDQLITDARESDDQAYRKTVYKQCLDTIVDWAVEIPCYQRQNCIIFSPQRIKMDTVTPDITTFYGWMAEIENLEMN